MATLTVLDLDGETTLDDNSVAAGAGGDVFLNDGGTVLYVNNAGGVSVTVTATAQNTSWNKPGVGDFTVSNKTLTIAAGKNGTFGNFPQSVFNNASGQVALTYDQVTSVSVAPLKFVKKD